MANKLVENNLEIAYVISKAVCTLNNKLQADGEFSYTTEKLSEVALGVLKELDKEGKL